jgi:hypothetical protein
MTSMAFAARQHENILFPVPFAENEDPPLIITNLRIVQRGYGGAVVELETRDVHSIGRHVVRPGLPLGVMLLALALPLIGFGGYEIYSVWGMTAASPLSLFGAHDDAAAPSPPSDGDASATDAPRAVLIDRVVGIASLVTALGCALGARRLIRKKRYFVICRGERRMMKMRVDDEIEQTQVMVTVSALKGKAK